MNGGWRQADIQFFLNWKLQEVSFAELKENAEGYKKLFFNYVTGLADMGKYTMFIILSWNNTRYSDLSKYSHNIYSICANVVK